MACDRWRELLSAQLDGEDDPADRARVDQHLAGCAGCRQWLDRAATVNRLTRTGVATAPPDLTASIMAAVRQEPPARRFDPRPWLYVALAAVGFVQLILGLTQIGGGAGGHAHAPGLDATPGHLWHESAAWNVAVGAAYLFLALRRSRPSGLVPMLTAFVGTLLLLSVNDLTAGRVDATRLVSHGFVILGYLLVVTLSRTAGGAAATPPGARAGRGGGSSWRVSFENEPAAPRPGLRLVPPGPMTAAATGPGLLRTGSGLFGASPDAPGRISAGSGAPAHASAGWGPLVQASAGWGAPVQASAGWGAPGRVVSVSGLPGRVAIGPAMPDRVGRGAAVDPAVVGSAGSEAPDRAPATPFWASAVPGTRGRPGAKARREAGAERRAA